MTRLMNAPGSSAATLMVALIVHASASAGPPAVPGPGGNHAAASPGFAFLGPGRLVVGRNVRVEGVIGSRYGVAPEELDHPDGDPLTVASDFRGLDDRLDVVLDVFHDVVVRDDVNGDHRLRIDHPVEGANLGDHPELVDADGDGAIDDFDLFIDRYDVNDDGGVTYPAPRAAGLATEFRGVDDDLARLIDEAQPDRDGDGRVTHRDTSLGYRDGVLDGRDAYAKIRGGLAFAVSRDAWERAHGESWQTVVHGPVRAPEADGAVRFEVSEQELPEVTPERFDDVLAWFESRVPPPVPRDPGDPPVDPALLADEAIEVGVYVPRGDGDWEAVPFGSKGVFDHYRRPVYRDFTFRNVRIPMGNNALFVNCTFVGVTFIESEPRCTHQDWNYAGAVEPIDDGTGRIIYVLRWPDLPPPPPDHIDIDGIEVRNTRAYSNNLRFHACTFLGSIAGDRLGEHTHWRNRVQLTGATRAFLDVDEVQPPTLTDAAGTLLIEYLALLTDEERAGLARGTIVLPHWSVHTGGFEEDPPLLRLRGLIVTGVLEARGRIDVHGVVATTFRPVAGLGPLSYGGHPADFASVIGDPLGSRPAGAITLRADPAVSLPNGRKLARPGYGGLSRADGRPPGRRRER